MHGRCISLSFNFTKLDKISKYMRIGQLAARVRVSSFRLKSEHRGFLRLVHHEPNDKAIKQQVCCCFGHDPNDYNSFIF